MIFGQSHTLSEVMVLLAVSSALLAAFLSLFADQFIKASRLLVFIPLGISGLLATCSGFIILSGMPGFSIELPLGLPWLQWHLRFDPLSALFLGIIGIVTFAISLFGPAYVREYERSVYSQTVMGVATGLFVAGMQLVVVADDTYAFMIAWELMSVSSYMLVSYEHRDAANRRSAFLYLLMAQIGAVMILMAFGVLSGFNTDLSFDALRVNELSNLWATIAFLLAMFGFGMKAGIVPVHIWLPEAHPVAPSHISALMSGVMLKVAVYGFIRFTFDLLGDPQWSWGVAVLLIGSITALYGVLYALMQHDLKRLLAYSSVENIGIIYVALGLAMIFFGTGHPHLGLIGLIAALYHALNHALFKSLLFLGAGTIIQRCHERDLEHMGGFIHHMPWTSLFFLIGCLSISSLPPFNGFVSEWLTFQTALQATVISNGILRTLIPISAAMLALTGVLAAACFVRVYGIAFLGQGRAKRVRHVHEARIGILTAQAVLAGLCLLSGVFPTTIISGLSYITESLIGQSLSSATSKGWLWLTPVSPEVASYSAPLISLGIILALLVWGIVYYVSRKNWRLKAITRKDAWDCGFGSLNARMQYSATSFSMPIRQIFQPMFIIKEELNEDIEETQTSKIKQIRYGLNVEDVFWNIFYLPIERWVHAIARRVGRLQTGHLRHYLAYSFFTLLVLLWLIT